MLKALSLLPCALYAGRIAIGRRLPASALVILLVAPALGAASPSNPLAVRLETIRTAFLRNDANSLAEQFPADGRVLVNVSPATERLFLGPAQLRAFLTQLTRGYQTVTFEFTSPDQESGATRFVEARWVARDQRSGAVRTEMLSIALRRCAEDGAWRIAELKTAR